MQYWQYYIKYSGKVPCIFYFIVMFFVLLFTFYFLLFTFYFLLFTFYFLLFTFYFLLFTIHYSLFTMSSDTAPSTCPIVSSVPEDYAFDVLVMHQKDWDWE
jgi:hypothetical protein